MNQLIYKHIALLVSVFTDQPKHVSKFWSLWIFTSQLSPSNCSCKLYNLNVIVYYLILNYKKTDTSNIRKTLDWINWKNVLVRKILRLKYLFNETILNIFQNYLPNKHITCNDKDPVWMTENI